MSKKIKAGATTCRGLDVSHFQGKIDFKQVRIQGFEFVFVKATDSETYVDPMWAEDSANARKEGLLVGAYHFYHYVKDPIVQMDNLIKALGGSHKVGDLPPVVDVEWTDGRKSLSPADMLNVLKALTYLEQKLGVTPIVYASAGFSEFSSEFKRFPLWVASYRKDYAVVPNAWDNFMFWQQTDKDSSPGILGFVDGDLFNGSLEQLHALTGAPIITPRPAPTPMPVVAPGSGSTVVVGSGPSFFQSLWSKLTSIFRR